MNPLSIATLPIRLAARVAAGILDRRGPSEPVTPPPVPRPAAPPPPPAPAAARARSRAQAPRPAAARARSGAQAQRPRRDIGDVALARKVESVVFRDSEIDKGKIDVNAADGVVWLRGEAKTPDLIKRLEREASEIPEVDQVENLLHLPKTPAPTRTDTPPSQRKTRRTPRKQAQRKVTPRNVTAEKPAARGRPTPADRARSRSGRPAGGGSAG